MEQEVDKDLGPGVTPILKQPGWNSVLRRGDVAGVASTLAEVGEETGKRDSVYPVKEGRGVETDVTLLDCLKFIREEAFDEAGLSVWLSGGVTKSVGLG